MLIGEGAEESQYRWESYPEDQRYCIDWIANQFKVIIPPALLWFLLLIYYPYHYYPLSDQLG